MPFCAGCRYEYRETTQTCPTCGVQLVAELPPLPRRPGAVRRLGAWLSGTPMIGGWVRTARWDLPNFPRLLRRGVSNVYRHPILYLLPLAMLVAASAQRHSYGVLVLTAQGAARETTGFIPWLEEWIGGLWERVAEVPSYLAFSLQGSYFGHMAIRPLPSVVLPYPFGHGPPSPALSWPVLLHAMVSALVMAVVYAGLYGRLAALSMGRRDFGVLSAVVAHFLPMAGLAVLAWAVWLIVLAAQWRPAWVLWMVFSIFAFLAAPNALVVDRVHAHRAIALSVRFVLRHLPAVLVLLTAASIADALIMPQYGLREVIPSTAVFHQTLRLLVALCVWGMIMQWYVEASERESVAAQSG